MFHPKGPSLLELTKQWLSSTEQGYDLLAPKFDYTPFRTPDTVLSVVCDRLQQFAPFGSMLDVCCGTGAATQRLRHLCRHRLVGLDISAGMLKIACSTAKPDLGDAHQEFVRGNALDMPFGPSFDLAVCFGAFGHILPEEEPRLIQQIALALRPGGKFVFVTSEMPTKWSKAYWFSHGFNVVMHLRNWAVKPPFIMYYLTFLLPRAKVLLERSGFTVEVDQPFAKPLGRLRLVTATRESH